MSKSRLITFMLSVFVVGMVELMIAGILTLMSADLNISEAIIGQLVTVYAITFAISGPILVKLTKNVSPKITLLISMVLFVIGNGIIAISPNFTVLVLGRILSSAAAAIIVVKILSLTVVYSKPNQRGKMIGLVYTGFSAANVLGVPLGTKIGDLVGWRMTFVFICLVGVLAFILIIFNVSSDKLDTIKSEADHSSYKVLRPLEVVKYLSITFLILAANYVVVTYISPLLSVYGYDLNIVSLVLLVAGLGAILGTSLGGYITDALGSKKWLLISLSTYTVLMFVFQSFLPILVITLIGVFAWNIVQWGSNPPIQIGIISQLEGDTSAAMSWNMSSLNAGIGAGSLLGGIFVTYFDVVSSLYVAGTLSFLALLICLTLKKQPKTS
ncbi:MFS transporter [Mammaliicoccus stepanovicii]|uniref:Transporter n=1 Tax=Mammaliicoccus stepanovicii TaxID=643214 RepID=A0A239YGQ6_9STAP|nr:MFS transporter [Mammaliicoccus stepanovicii]PNZ75854.1 chloramphenicol resistance protein [Mammaliicoccus stepanovicii]GGI42759.1 chloramphenicol resistance protein [Mammaliicoccus stepanovicii]SNV57374.1 transporter [Mammaliicoccus stepanovicii]